MATSPLPVWTGIGHTGDQSVADLVANRSFITPTECGRELAGVVGEWWEEAVVGVAARIGRRARDVLADAERRDLLARGHLVSTAQHQLRWHRDRLVDRRRRLVLRSPEALDRTAAALHHRSGRLGPMALSHLHRGEERLVAWRRLLDAYNVDRQLERGYTLTLDAEGRVLRSAAGQKAGDEVRTRFADGTVTSVVRTVEDKVPVGTQDRAEERS